MGHFRAHVAVHEGGHAVVALALGLEVVEISLCGGDDTELKFFTRYGFARVRPT